ncbi:hypothetical protein IE53DRAFT_345765 [Violaceomyces palustris]|uniref:Uncharacterized protein n=1 Tax=Violaceomyces palustris TaxID=1673888 RepID=A0ACD0NUT4_9BASI|nr:hypothetical protein IE53DRAFT_345765 [Violaceomyces palustris]
MFKPLGLLKTIPCPEHVSVLDGNSLPPPFCPFSHSASVKFERIVSSSEVPPPVKRSPYQPVSILKNDQVSGLKNDQVSGLKNAQVSGLKRRIDSSIHPTSAKSSTSTSSSLSIDSSAQAGKKRRISSSPASTYTSAASSFSLARASPSPSSKVKRTEEDEGGWSVVDIKPPTLKFSDHPKTSSITLSQRQAGLKSFHSYFSQLYSPLLRQDKLPLLKTLAQRLSNQNALEQEEEVFKNASKFSYKNSCLTCLVSLKRRDAGVLIELVEQCHRVWLRERGTGEVGQVEAKLKRMIQDCSQVGTVSQVERKRASEKAKQEGRLTREGLARRGFLCPKGDLVKFDYLVEVPDSWGEGGEERDCKGQVKECERCSSTFMVGGEADPTGGSQTIPQDPKACRYHWGKKRWEKSTTTKSRAQAWNCCGRLVEESTGDGEEACCLGPHVFKEESTRDLHKREGFITTERLEELMKERNESTCHQEIVAMDCELSYTTSGMSLTRLTLVGEDGEVLLDELVRCKADIIDYNTRWSGINEEDYRQKAILDLVDVRKAMARFVNRDTILIGHGLENDLRAVRLVHTNVVDTALLYKHPKGYPFRMSLKELSWRYLGKIIQSSGEWVGHSSKEDACMALELVRHKFVDEKTCSSTTSEEEGKKSVGVGVETKVPATTATHGMV